MSEGEPEENPGAHGEVELSESSPLVSGSDGGQNIIPRKGGYPCMIFLIVGGGIGLCVCILLVAALGGILGAFAGIPPKDPLERATWLMSRYPLVDGHNDLPYRLGEILKLNLTDIRKFHLDRPFTEQEKSSLSSRNISLHSTLPKMREGCVGAQFFVVYADCSNATPIFSVEKALEAFSILGDLNEVYEDEVVPAVDPDGIALAFRQDRLATMIGVEGGQMIDMDLSILRQYYRMGARYLTLTHNCNTRWADSCCDREGPIHGGLTDWGKGAIREMNRLGIAVDLSHTSVDTMNDALDVSSAPVIFSHANAYALCHHKRNVPDDVLRRLKENNGIVMVTFVPSFVSEIERLVQLNISAQYAGHSSEIRSRILQWERNHPEQRASAEMVADHIDHIREIHGDTVDHIGIGSDFDGISYVPLGLEDTSKFPNLIAVLVRREYSDEQIKKILGENIMRVLDDIREEADKLTLDTMFEL